MKFIRKIYETGYYKKRVIYEIRDLLKSKNIHGQCYYSDDNKKINLVVKSINPETQKYLYNLGLECIKKETIEYKEA